MKINSIVVIIFIVFASFVPGKKQRTVKPAAQAPFGHVQYIKSVAYQAKMGSFGKIIKGDIISDEIIVSQSKGRDPAVIQHASAPPPINVCTYDAIGNEIENTQYHTNGKLCGRITYIYDENGDVKEEFDSSFTWLCSYPGPGVYPYQYRYSYNSKGKLLEAITYDRDTVHPESVIQNTYNAQEQLIETAESIKNRIPHKTTIFGYDESGRLYTINTYYANVGLTGEEQISFENTGITSVAYCYNMNRVFYRKVVKKTFTDTHTIREETYDGNNRFSDFTISHFDSENHLKDSCTFHINHYFATSASKDTKPDDTVMVQHFVNDKHHNVVLDDYFSSDGIPAYQKSFKYTYDKTGNWITRIQFDNNIPTQITEREIHYFNHLH